MSKNFYTTIGLEIHAELSTKSKMFCSCKNDPNEKNPNTNICPVCMAHPGTLPVPNKQAIENVIKVGLAINGNIADFTEFDRKNYFYPDIPKGYQISQYKFPIVSGGHLADFDVTRIHLEEDTGTSKHDRGDFSLVDFNRAGVPLMELVTEPHTFDSAELASKAAGRFARELQLVLLSLGVSEANMDKGEMRVEVNMSVSDDKAVYGTKVEVKNLNSFRSAERAILFETERMIKLIESGEGDKIVQETRGWNEAKQSTFSQRSKENAQDYRYFPDPDIPKLYLSKLFDIEKLKRELPELPAQKRERYRTEFGRKNEDIEIYISNPGISASFENSILNLERKNILNSEVTNTASNFYISSVLGNYNDEELSNEKLAENISELSNLTVNNTISASVAKGLIAEKKDILFKEAMEIISERSLVQKNDEGVLKEIVQKIIDANQDVVATYKGGKENALMSLVGQVMKESKGSANPQMVQKLLKEML